MALATIAEATAQYNANLDWDSDPAKARLALSALRFLRVNRASNLSHVGSGLTFSAIDAEIDAIQGYLQSVGSSANRASFTIARRRWT